MSAETRGALDHLVVADGGVVRIRRKHASDAERDYAWRQDAELMRYDGGEPLEMGFLEFARRLEHDLAFPRTDRCVFAIETPEGEHIGNCMYYNADPYDGSAEFGISIAVPQYRGRGIGTAAVVTFLRYLWANHPLRLVVLHTLEWNERAARSFEKAGFGSPRPVVRDGKRLVRMEARREWWLLWEAEGRFEAVLSPAGRRAQG